MMTVLAPEPIEIAGYDAVARTVHWLVAVLAYLFLAGRGEPWTTPLEDRA